MVKSKKAVKDKYYRLAKEQGYRARSCFKLIQLNRKYNLLADATRVIDLCAAPGGWMQVAAKTMPRSPGRQIIGVDLLPIKPLKGCVALQADITTQRCRQMIKKELQGKQADLVLCDGAPNVGADYTHDAFVQSELVVHALRFATDHLIKGGNFVSKVFRSADYNALMWAFQQLFERVEATKPASSRNVSAEIFVVCRGYLAPAKIDPKLLDPKHVFKQILPDKKAAGALLFHKKNLQKRNRDGYDTALGQGLHRSMTVSEFVHPKTDAMDVLAEVNEIKFDDPALPLKQHKETTAEVLACLKDIKVLGKSELRLLLRWHSTMKKYIKSLRDMQPSAEKEAAEEEKEVEDVEEAKAEGGGNDDADEEVEIAAEMEELHDSLARKKRKEKKKKAREHAKQMNRKALGMKNDYAIDLEDVNEGPFSMKALKLRSKDDLDGIREVNLSQADASQIPNETDTADDSLHIERGSSGESDDDMEEEEDEDAYMNKIEAELNSFHTRAESKKEESAPMSVRQRRQQQKAEKLAKQKKRKLEKLQEDDIHKALQEEEAKAVDRGEYHKLLATDGTDDEDSDQGEEKNSDEGENEAVKKWYSQSLFAGVDVEAEEEEEEEDTVGLPSQKTDKHVRHEKRVKQLKKKAKAEERTKRATAAQARGLDDDTSNSPTGTFETVKASATSDQGTDGNEKDADVRKLQEKSAKTKELISRGFGKQHKDETEAEEKSGAQGFEVVATDRDEEYHSSDYDSDENAHAVALGSLLLKKSTRRKLLDAGYNRYAFNDDDNLPSWFVADENKHNRPQLPITKEMVNAVKQRYKDLAAKPMNKVAEARARKRRKLAMKVETAKKKAAAVVDAPDLTPRAKMKAIEKLYKGTTGIKRPAAVYVVSKKASKGKPKVGKISGKRVKIVDRRLKADPGKRTPANGKAKKHKRKPKRKRR